MDKLPLIVTPHPLNDLSRDEVKALAQAAYPVIIAHLTSETLPEATPVEFIHPAERTTQQSRAATGDER